MIVCTWLGVSGVGFVTNEADSAPTVQTARGVFTGSAVTADGLDSVGYIDCKGVTGAAVLTVGSDSKSVVLRPKPKTDSVCFSSVSCLRSQFLLPVGDAMHDLNPDIYFALGDFPYTDSAKPALPGLSAPLDSDGSDAQQNFINHHAHMRANPAIQKLSDKVPILYMFDDHEWAGGDWDHSLIHANFNRDLTDHANLTDMVNDHWLPGRLACDKFMQTNPPAASESAEMPGAIADDVTAAANFSGSEATYWPVCYFDYQLGPVHFFVIDCKSYMDPTATGTSDSDFINSLASTGHPEISTANKQMLGVNQYNWLTTGLLNSNAPFKGIMSVKQFMTGNALNTDEWRFYAWQRDALLSYIDTNAITGVFFVTGDDHVAALELGWQSAANAPYGIDSTTYDLVMINGCPSGTNGTFADMNRTGNKSDYERYRDPKAAPVFYHGVATSERCDHSLRLSTGKVIWSGYQLASENFIRYPDQLVAVA